MAISSQFKKRFQELVEEQDYQKSSMPARIGIDYSIFSRAINYGIVPRPKVLMRIADYFHTSIVFLLGMSDNDDFEQAKIKVSFVDRLEELRTEKNMSYYEISQKLHLDRTNFTNWRRNHYIPSLDYLFLLADFFDVSIDFLLGRTDEKQS